jgi:hypothetical protein
MVLAMIQRQEKIWTRRCNTTYRAEDAYGEVSGLAYVYNDMKKSLSDDNVSAVRSDAKCCEARKERKVSWHQG